jgi:ubiquinone/menaquinone biosynthesis C-methylase UbiE
MNSPTDHIVTAPTETTTDFGRLYLAIREREKRVYTDAEVSRLPDIDLLHPHYAEWQTRKRSAARLINYLHKKQRPLNILEVGCGNGWLAAKIADIPRANVTGIDINLVETDQAERVFRKENLRFICGRFDDINLNGQLFDVIVFAAVLPYFASVTGILKLALSHLYPGGELHILDTPFHTAEETGPARERCIAYYNRMGFPEMSGQYFHHTINELEGFNYRVLFSPRSLVNRLTNKDRFPWICITGRS